MATQEAESLILDLQSRRRSLSDQVVVETQRLWHSQMLPNDLDGSWDRLAGTFAMAAYNGQLASATLTAPFIDEVSRVQGFKQGSLETARESYAGVAPDGAGLTPLLYGAVTEAKIRIGAGWATAAALDAGAAFMAAVIKTMIADMGRYHDMTRMRAKGYTRYTRVVNPGACSRCAILAGIASSAVAFPRHPNCACTAVPTAGQSPFGSKRLSNPSEYFESLSRAEQDRIFTLAGAQAIRDGADIFSVVNARRGASGISFSGAIGRGNTVPLSGRRLIPVQIGVKPDGSPLMAYTTSEGTTRLGQFGRRTDATRRSQSLRLMPEQIYRMAGNDPIRVLELLRRYGYIF